MALFTLPKAERISGTTSISALMEKGRSGVAGCLRYKYLVREIPGPNRIMVSVPKKNFKRAVKRNLLKRRIREAYRLQKGLAGPGIDVLFVYISREVLPFETIFAAMTEALSGIAASTGTATSTGTGTNTGTATSTGTSKKSEE